MYNVHVTCTMFISHGWTSQFCTHFFSTYKLKKQKYSVVACHMEQSHAKDQIQIPYRFRIKNRQNIEKITTKLCFS